MSTPVRRCEKLGSAILREASPSVIPRAEGVTRRASHRGTVGLECLKEHASLEAKVQRFVNVQALTGGAGLTLHDTSRVLAFGVRNTDSQLSL